MNTTLLQMTPISIE